MDADEQHLNAPLSVAGLDDLDRTVANLGFHGFKIIAKIGSGGMARVYKAQQISVRRFVAIKVLNPDMMSADRFRDLFRKEIDTLAQLRHPNIVALIDAGETQGLPYFVMEYVEGPTLRRLMAAQDLKVGHVITICKKICEALDAAHRINIVHRDMKPENVMITRTGQVKLTDFGVAAIRVAQNDQSVERQSQANSDFSGTTIYAPPEGKTGGTNDARSDIYSVGVMLYEMLTLSLPAGRVQPPSIANPKCPKWLDQVTMRAISIKPGDRFASAGALLAALNGGEAVAARSALESRLARRALKRLPAQETANIYTLLGVVSVFFSVVAASLLILSLFAPYFTGFANNLDWERYLQDSHLFPVPFTSVVIGLACLSLATTGMRNDLGRSLLQTVLALCGFAAMEYLIEQSRSLNSLTYQGISAEVLAGTYLYSSAIAALTLGSLISPPKGARKVLLILYPVLLSAAVFLLKRLTMAP